MFVFLPRRVYSYFLLLLLIIFSGSSYSQVIKKVSVETFDNDQKVIYDTQNPEAMGQNFVQLYKNNYEFKIRFIVEVHGDNLPDRITLVTNTDKGPEYIASLIRSLKSSLYNDEFFKKNLEKLLHVLPKSSTDPYLFEKTEYPELLTELYKNVEMKRISSSNNGLVKYSTDFFEVKNNQTSNVIFKIYNQDGSSNPIPLYYEPNIHRRNIYTLNLVVSPDRVRSVKISSVNPYQLGEVVNDKKDATAFKVLNREKWEALYESTRDYVDENDVFEDEIFKVKNETTGETGYLKVLSLDHPLMSLKLTNLVEKTNVNTLWFMPINEPSFARMSPELKKSRMVDIGDGRYIVTPIARNDATGDVYIHKGLLYPHETTAYEVSTYLGGNVSASKLISEFNKKGITIMLDEHPDKVSSFRFEYSNLSDEANRIIIEILKSAGYSVHNDDLEKPLNLLTTKLRHIHTGDVIYAYQFFMLKYDYNGRDLNPDNHYFVKKEDRVPLSDINAMPMNPAEIYFAGAGHRDIGWLTFAQLRLNNPYVELIDMIARLDYYEQLFAMSENPKVGIRMDAIHVGLLKYDERSQFVRYLNQLRQVYPDIIVGGEIIESGANMSWLGMPLDFILPPTLLHVDNAYFMSEFGRNNKGQKEWENVIRFLKYKNKAYFASISSYDTPDPIAKEPFNMHSTQDKCENTYSNPIDWFTKEAYVYFAPNALLSICAGEECAPNNDYKNFKGDQFGYFQLPYEEGNLSQERVDLVSTYPLLDYLKSYLQENKYGYKFKNIDSKFLDYGYLSCDVYVSDKGVVIMMRNNGNLNVPMHHDFDSEIFEEVNKWKMANESLYIVFDSYSFDYAKGELYKLYKPDDSMLFENYEFTSSQLKLRRSLKPYETIVLTTLDKNELYSLKGEYLKAIMAAYLNVDYRSVTMPEIIDEFYDVFFSKRDKENKAKVEGLFYTYGLLEWMKSNEAPGEIKQRLPKLESLLAFSNSEADLVPSSEINNELSPSLYRVNAYLELSLDPSNSLESKKISILRAEELLSGLDYKLFDLDSDKETWSDLNEKIASQKSILWPDKYKFNESLLRSSVLEFLGQGFDYLGTEELVQEFYRASNWMEAKAEAIIQSYYYAVEQSEQSSSAKKEDYLYMSLLFEYYIKEGSARNISVDLEDFRLVLRRNFDFRLGQQLKLVDVNSTMYRPIKEQSVKNINRGRTLRVR
jgi:hypothetical protein